MHVYRCVHACMCVSDRSDLACRPLVGGSGYRDGSLLRSRGRNTEDIHLKVGMCFSEEVSR